jgi:hypothetical protein
MDSLIFPNTIVDNFLDDPHKYVEFADTLEYSPSQSGSWPGVRSKDLSVLYPNMVERLLKKMFSLFYTFDQNIVDFYSCSSNCYFQKVSSDYNNGWVHMDNCQLTAIVYLCNSGYGTSLCKPKDITTFYSEINSEKKYESHNNVDRLSEFQKYKDENNNLFNKTVTVDSQFNRLFLFESHFFHSADNFCNKDDNKDRLTMIFFINRLCVKNFPIQRCKIG